MTSTSTRTVLITGCSSGIGEATARHLATQGWSVYATARRPETLEGLASVGCHTLALDVSDEGSMRAAVTHVEQEAGAVGVLVNNAGYSQSGPIEQVSMNAVRRQFETNVFGLIRMCQLVLPGMRREHFGKIVNMSSMGGEFVFPGGGFYHASKYAVEAISDALRFEVRGFGVDVMIIQPGLIRTAFADVAVNSMDGDGGSAQDRSSDPYAEFSQNLSRATREVYERGPLARLGGPPEAVAHTVARAIAARRPRARYRVTPSARLLIAQRRVLPDALWDRLLRSQFPQPH